MSKRRGKYWYYKFRRRAKCCGQNFERSKISWTIFGLAIGLKYRNWANGRPLNQTDVDCVEISVDEQNKWLDVKCEKKNAVLCEKYQDWSIPKIKNVLEQIRRQYSERMDLIEANLVTREKEIVQLKLNQTRVLNRMETKLNELDQFNKLSTNLIDTQRKDLDQLIKNQTNSLNSIYAQRKQLDQLLQNPVPIGFIYVQLSGQSEPSHSLASNRVE